MLKDRAIFAIEEQGGSQHLDNTLQDIRDCTWSSVEYNRRSPLADLVSAARVTQMLRATRARSYSEGFPLRLTLNRPNVFAGEARPR